MTQIFNIRVKQKSALNSLSQTICQETLLTRIIIPEQKILRSKNLGNSR